ncbi:MAG TPA: TIGR01212 family radical SAM protein [Lachnospiraceae bacterium]|nr:TIGR01212 family radical SAM protein [Lachnospiraceae bacterium]
MILNSNPYNSLNNYLKTKFGTKVAKLSLDGGFTCPNRDGTLSTEGCIFCSEGGSGDFAGKRLLSISQQIEQQKQNVSKKWPNAKYISYFQAFTNTYAPIDILRSKYTEAISQSDVVGLAIATRPDCLGNDVIELLKELNKKTYVWVELGLQTCNEKTAKYINRGYENYVFEDAVSRLNLAGIHVVVHLILGLPNETHEDMLNSVKYICSFNIQGIKIQLLHVLKNTPLGAIHKNNPFHILTKDEYLSLVCIILEHIPKEIVIHRLTGDGAKINLIAPQWSGNKKDVLNSLNKLISEKNIHQGCKIV